MNSKNVKNVQLYQISNKKLRTMYFSFIYFAKIKIMERSW